MKRLTQLAPTIFAIGFILNLYIGNISELFLSSLVTPVTSAILVSLVITIISSLLLRNKTKGVTLASLFVILFFALRDVLPKMNQEFVLAIGIALVVLAFIFLKRTKRNLDSLGKFFLITSLLLFGIAVFRITQYEIKKSNEPVISSPLKLPVVSSTTSKADVPDIYYIVPDSYSASKSLFKYYNFDNSQFLNFLTEKGFFIASDSASNYPKTFLSLGSSLNMEYLDYLSKFKNSSDLTKVDPLLEDNNVVKFLTSAGYKYYHLGSWWGATHTNKNAYQNVILENENAIPMSQFDYIVLQSTIVDPLIDKFLPSLTVGDSDRDRMNRANYQFEQLGKLANEPGPKFVFAHVIAPHEPYFYDKNCKFQNLDTRKRRQEVPKYVDHLNCVNQKLEGTVNEILKNSKKPPVIIIQSDEGAPFLAEEMTPPDSWGKAPLSLLQEKFPVFNAYYLPEASGSSGLYESITPVNSFRVIFNRYLGTNFPILPDRSYILPDLKHLYDFVDVTDRIKQ